jgi:predicted metal-dependent phosphoesterase TrpH
MQQLVAGTADLHVHTHFSDGNDSPEAVLQTARSRRLDVLAITDHDCLVGAILASAVARRCGGPPYLVVGEEITSSQGHILGLFLRELVHPGQSAADTIAAIHEQGGLAIAAHPFWRALSATEDAPRGVGALVFDLPFDAVETRNGGFTPSMMRANRRAESAARALALPRTGGSDAHVRQAIGWAHTRFPGSTPDDLRQAILAGTTSAGALLLNPAGVMRYAAWGLTRTPRVEVSG